MNFKAVIFDLDGTLLDTLEDIADSMNRVLSNHGFPIHEVDNYRYFVGDGVAMLVKRTLPGDRKDDEIVNQCMEEFREEYDRNNNKMTKVYDGVAETLNGLSDWKIRLAVLSNKPHDSTMKCMVEFLSDWEFDMVLGQKDGIPRKPDPAGALRITEFLKLKPGEVIYVGDTDVDMRTAVSAGMYPAGALWGFREYDELRKSGARLLIHRPQEILNLIGVKSNDDN
jgi:phosphoglycolate phosphatase